jgi:hypothetical protein
MFAFVRFKPFVAPLQDVLDGVSNQRFILFTRKRNRETLKILALGQKNEAY